MTPPPRPTELRQGDVVTYSPQVGPLRRGRIAIGRTDAFAAVDLTGGPCVLVERRTVTRVIAPQWEPDF